LETWYKENAALKFPPLTFPSSPTSSQGSERTLSPDPPPTLDEFRAEERRFYDKLINDGGRPGYPLELLDDLTENPRKHSSILSMLNLAADQWQVFEAQFDRWTAFRMWQRDNRGIDEEEAELAAFIAEVQRHGKLWHWTYKLNNPDALGRKRTYWLQDRRLRREREREASSDAGFAGYVEAVNRRLSKHGFTKTLYLAEDPRVQDRWSTWIEYLNYEYWRNDELHGRLQVAQ
jgi:hypothetical protein